MKSSSAAVLLAVVPGVLAFAPVSTRISRHGSLSRYMSEETVEEVVATPQVEEPALDNDPRLFDMNRRVRLGRSRDQDGKSNIWSIEPTMEVVETEESSLNSNLKVAGIVIGAALAALPLFSVFSTLFPDPSDF